MDTPCDESPVQLQDDLVHAALYHAVQHGDLKNVKSLLESGANVDTLSEGGTFLFHAASRGDLEAVKMLVEWGASIDFVPPDDGQRSAATPLFIAACNGNLDVAQYLLEKGANMNVECSVHCTHKRTPLQIAAKNRHKYMVKLLEEHKARINERIPVGESLQAACGHGYLELVNFLLESGADIELEENGNTPLKAAAQSGHTEIVKLLLERGAIVDKECEACSARYYSPLMLASRHGHIEVVKLLLEAGAQNFKCSSGTALHFAASNGHSEIAKLLLGKKDFVNVKHSDEGYTPLYCAIGNNDFELAGLLLDHGASVNDYCGYHELETPFQRAIREDNVEMTKLLLRGAQPSDLSDHVFFASKKESFQVLQYLLQVSPELAFVDEGELLFEVVASTHCKSSELLQILIDCGIDVNAHGSDRVYKKYKVASALYYAVSSRQTEKVWKLVLNGADTRLFITPKSDSNEYATMWEMCEGDKATRKALLHFWTPHSHKYHPKQVRDAVRSVMLIAKQQQWPFDQLVLLKILSFVAFDFAHSTEIEQITIDQITDEQIAAEQSTEGIEKEAQGILGYALELLRKLWKYPWF